MPSLNNNHAPNPESNTNNSQSYTPNVIRIASRFNISTITPNNQRNLSNPDLDPNNQGDNPNLTSNNNSVSNYGVNTELGQSSNYNQCSEFELNSGTNCSNDTVLKANQTNTTGQIASKHQAPSNTDSNLNPSENPIFNHEINNNGSQGHIDNRVNASAPTLNTQPLINRPDFNLNNNRGGRLNLSLNDNYVHSHGYNTELMPSLNNNHAPNPESNTNNSQSYTPNVIRIASRFNISTITPNNQRNLSNPDLDPNNQGDNTNLTSNNNLVFNYGVNTELGQSSNYNQYGEFELNSGTNCSNDTVLKANQTNTTGQITSKHQAPSNTDSNLNPSENPVLNHEINNNGSQSHITNQVNDVNSISYNQQNLNNSNLNGNQSNGNTPNLVVGPTNYTITNMDLGTSLNDSAGNSLNLNPNENPIFNHEINNNGSQSHIVNQVNDINSIPDNQQNNLNPNLNPNLNGNQSNGDTSNLVVGPTNHTITNIDLGTSLNGSVGNNPNLNSNTTN